MAPFCAASSTPPICSNPAFTLLARPTRTHPLLLERNPRLDVLLAYSKGVLPLVVIGLSFAVLLGLFQRAFAQPRKRINFPVSRHIATLPMPPQALEQWPAAVDLCYLVSGADSGCTGLADAVVNSQPEQDDTPRSLEETDVPSDLSSVSVQPAGHVGQDGQSQESQRSSDAAVASLGEHALRRYVTADSPTVPLDLPKQHSCEHRAVQQRLPAADDGASVPEGLRCDREGDEGTPSTAVSTAVSYTHIPCLYTPFVYPVLSLAFVHYKLFDSRLHSNHELLSS
ncbi:hypothetical protein C8R45DRAFT_451124 [Mycena sanguinolenta]|nr:hypothetical protein C8R45DRAFT_451124 [Mycena sanguinolenta]